MLFQLVIGLIGSDELLNEPISELVSLYIRHVLFSFSPLMVNSHILGNERMTIKDPFTDPMGLIGVR